MNLIFMEYNYLAFFFYFSLLYTYVMCLLCMYNDVIGFYSDLILILVFLIFCIICVELLGKLADITTIIWIV